MKNRALLLLLLLVSSAPLYAQLVRRDNQQSQIGIRVGANFASVQDGVGELQGMKDQLWIPRFTAGLATSFWSGKAFAFAPELNYSQRGQETEGSSSLGNYTFTTHYNYLEVPLMFRYTIGRQLLRGYINAGPTVSYLLSGKEITTLSGVKTTKKIDSEDERFSPFEVGAAVGGGLHVNTLIGSFMLDLRYHHGFTDIQQEGFTLAQALVPDYNPEQYRTQYVSVSLIFLGPYRE